MMTDQDRLARLEPITHRLYHRLFGVDDEGKQACEICGQPLADEPGPDLVTGARVTAPVRPPAPVPDTDAAAVPALKAAAAAVEDARRAAQPA